MIKKTLRSSLPLIIFVFVFVAVFTFLKTRGTGTTSAASLDNFKPGNIISDYVMSNSSSMSEAEIQKFLSEHGNCNNTETYKADWWPSVYYHIKDGHFVCLSEETFGEGTAYGEDAPNGISAAHIIYEAAKDYNINPQVLIVLLEKEQGLISDSWPNSRQYRSATGYGCPDTAACDEKYYGFKNQVRNAASMFRTVLDGGWTNYPVGENYIQYNPNAACGGSIVNVENLATSALYRYTPYQPNAAALSVGYGTAPCGAYGNRNFYLYFSDWFGDPAKTIKIFTKEEILANLVAIDPVETDFPFQYKTYIQNVVDWMDWSNGGEMAGTTGFSLSIEGIAIKLNNATGIEYRTHIQDKGWEAEYKKDGEESGLPGGNKRIEAIQIRLTGDMANKYDVYYRVHVQDYGWQDWSINDEIAGTTGESKRIEAIQIKLVKKVVKEPADYHVHVQDYGWQDWVKNGELAGTTGESKRLEAIEVKLDDTIAEKYDIYYHVHVQDYGWQDWVKNGELAGTTGESKRLEAIEVKLVKK